MDITRLQSKFKSTFNNEATFYKSPGRINIIGEHTDYNHGFVLPAAIDKAVYVGVSKREDQLIKLYALKYEDHFEVLIDHIKPSEKQWANYILGVASEVLKLNGAIGGFNLIVDGDVPDGAGLSSSAALECAVAFALNDQFSLGISKLQMVQIAQRAEHNYAGVMCGIMDQFASGFGKKDHAMMLDCKTLDFKYIPVKMDGYKFVLFNTNIKHNLASSAYNKRRASCMQGVEWIQDQHPTVNSLRDASLSMLDECVKDKDLDTYVKCKFVIEEIARLQAACVALEENNLALLGEKMFATHDGLSKAYEVSCEELDYLVDQVRAHPDVLGARMMGGGFGGCTINLVKEEAVDALAESLAKKYNSQFGLKMSTYIVKIENGSEKIDFLD